MINYCGPAGSITIVLDSEDVEEFDEWANKDGGEEVIGDKIVRAMILARQKEAEQNGQTK